MPCPRIHRLHSLVIRHLNCCTRARKRNRANSPSSEPSEESLQGTCLAPVVGIKIAVVPVSDVDPSSRGINRPEPHHFLPATTCTAFLDHFARVHSTLHIERVTLYTIAVDYCYYVQGMGASSAGRATRWGEERGKRRRRRRNRDRGRGRRTSLKHDTS
jgi:hypothetical protein